MADRSSRSSLHLARAAGLFLTATASCVYFNTYYNAEKYFRQAEKARVEEERGRGGAELGRGSGRGSRGAGYESLYEKAVRKASIVLEKHPESELVDDAMFLVGQALYWQRDYAYGARSFQDLEENFPDSEYVDRARLWRARCQRDLGHAGEARALLTALVLERSHVGDRAGMELGDMAAAGGDLRAAIYDYRTTLSAFSRTPLADQLWLRIGNAHFALDGAEDLDSAVVAYDRALGEARADSVKYRARLNRGRVLYRQGEPVPALDAYRSLLREGRFRPWEGETRILIGRYHRESGALPAALEEFERVRDDFPGTAVSAMVLYQTGLVYLQDRGDRPQAQDYFKEVGRERRGSEADSLARVMLVTTGRLDALLEEIYGADSTAAALQAGSLSTSPEAEPDTAAVQEPVTGPPGSLGAIGGAVMAGTGLDTAVSSVGTPVDSTAAKAADSTGVPGPDPTLAPERLVPEGLDIVAGDSLGAAEGLVTAAAVPDTAVSAAGIPVDSTAAQVADSTEVPGSEPALAPEPLVPEGLEGYVADLDSLGRWVPLVGLPPGPKGPEGEERARERRRRRLLERRPGSKVPTLMDNLFSAAEVYREGLGLPDSAAVLYNAIADRFPGSPQIPRALFNLAWTHIEQRADSTAARPILERLVAEHPTTEHASEARRYLGLPDQASAEEQAAEAFAQIERVRLEFPEEPARWVPELDDLAGAYPGTRVAARAAFLAAWAAENVQSDSAGAAARYDSILVLYPGSSYADLVGRRRQAERDGVVDRLGRELKSLREGTDPVQRLVLVAVEPMFEDSTSRARNHVGFGMRALRRGDFSAAQELFLLSLDEKGGPGNSEPLVGLGESNWQQGYLEDAVDYLRQALRQRSKSILPHYRLFAYHVRQGREDSANTYLRTIARRDRESPGVRDLLVRFPDLAAAKSEPLDLDGLEKLELEPEEEVLELPLRYFGVAEPPLLRSSRLPEYPAGQTDSITVYVDVLVSETGQAEEVSLYQGDEPFASAALAAAAGYTFYPAEGNDERPARTWAEVAVPFSPPSVEVGEEMAEPSKDGAADGPPLLLAEEDLAGRGAEASPGSGE